MTTSSFFNKRLLGALLFASVLGATPVLAQNAPPSGGATGSGAAQGGSGAPGGGTGTPGAIVNGTTATGIGTSSTGTMKPMHHPKMKMKKHHSAM